MSLRRPWALTSLVSLVPSVVVFVRRDVEGSVQQWEGVCVSGGGLCVSREVAR